MFSGHSSPIFDGFLSYTSPSMADYSLNKSYTVEACDPFLLHHRPYDCNKDTADHYFSPPCMDARFLQRSPYASPLFTSTTSPVYTAAPILHTNLDSAIENSHLQRLYNNPMFQDLQKLLAQECLHMQVPTNLINNAWSMQSSGHTRNEDKEEVFSRHMKLQEKLINLRSDESFRSRGLEIESDYSSEVGQIEVARYQALCAAGSSNSQRLCVNMHFDDKRMTLINRYEKLLEKVIIDRHFPQKKSDRDSIQGLCDNSLMKSDVINSNIAVPHNRPGCKFPVARHLEYPSKDTISSDSTEVSDEYSSAASSPECLEVDLSHDSISHDKSEGNAMNKDTNVNLCDSGVCADDSCSVSSDSGSDSVQSDIKETTENTESDNFNKDDMDNICVKSHEKINDNQEEVKSEKRKIEEGNIKFEDSKYLCTEENKMRGRSKQLSNLQTHILMNWYNEHIRYPYPSDLEVDGLSELTGLTCQQIKKWMANKRVRNYNTLSISGNQHPIKFKFKGNRACSVSKQPNKSTYQQLNHESRKILNDWYDNHMDYPYPNEEEKKNLAKQAAISEAQVKSWFANKRSRAQNTKRQVPNYFIKRFPEYTSHVQMVSMGRELARKAKRHQYEAMLSITGGFS